MSITQKSVPTTNEIKWKNKNIREQILLEVYNFTLNECMLINICCVNSFISKYDNICEKKTYQNSIHENITENLPWYKFCDNFIEIFKKNGVNIKSEDY